MTASQIHSAVWLASVAGDTQLVRVLVKHGADVNELDQTGPGTDAPTPLWAALPQGNYSSTLSMPQGDSSSTLSRPQDDSSCHQAGHRVTA
jgi:hypothetical protein